MVPAEAHALLDAPPSDVILLDARRDLVKVRTLCRLIETTGKKSPLLVVVSEGAVRPETWHLIPTELHQEDAANSTWLRSQLRRTVFQNP